MAGGVVGGWSRLDGGAHVAMISIPMLLTRRGWLGWATPYFLSLFLRLTSLHAPRPQFSSSFPRLLQPSSDPLAIFYSVIFASLPFTPPPHPHFPIRSTILLHHSSIFPACRVPPSSSFLVPFASVSATLAQRGPL